MVKSVNTAIIWFFDDSRSLTKVLYDTLLSITIIFCLNHVGDIWIQMSHIWSSLPLFRRSLLSLHLVFLLGQNAQYCGEGPWLYKIASFGLNLLILEKQTKSPNFPISMSQLSTMAVSIFSPLPPQAWIQPGHWQLEWPCTCPPVRHMPPLDDICSYLLDSCYTLSKTLPLIQSSV